MMWSEKSKWIWIDEEPKWDTYGEFYSEFEADSGNAGIRISADSNYMIYVNGRFVYSGQYPDYPHYKVYDEIDISKYLVEGKNKLAITVWYYGKENHVYSKGNAALRFEIFDDDKVLDFSSAETLSRKSIAFKNEYQKEITFELGFSFLYDLTKEDNWQNGEHSGFSKSRVVEQELPLYIRPVKLLVIDGKTESKLIKKGENYYLYDLGREEVGFLSLKVKSPVKQKLDICYGEHIVDGGVRSQIGDRDFSVEVVVGEGENDYTNYFRRLGLRYLEIYTENDIEIEYAGVIQCEYPLTDRDVKLENPLHQKIYDVCKRTLRLCIHEHHEDTPWREQSLYAMDSRNQMLCGYYAFEETEMQRASHLLLSKSQWDCGLLALTAPGVYERTIVSFSLAWITAIKEYLQHTGDAEFVKEILPVMKKLMMFFTERMENGLVRTDHEHKYWNFYEWTYRMDNERSDLSGDFDAPLNASFAIALRDYMYVCENIGNDAEKKWAEEIYESLKDAFHPAFYCEDNKAYKTYIDDKEPHFAQLTQAFALLGGVVPQEVEDDVRKNVINPDFVEASLSYCAYKYDALLMDRKNYQDIVISDIERQWGYMLDCGATSFWETILGEADFEGAGSLCHGWSAVPVYILSKVFGEDK